jgi:hypothetical protein
MKFCTLGPVLGLDFHGGTSKEDLVPKWLLDVRGKLLRAEPIDLRAAPTAVSWVHLNGVEDHQRCLAAARARPRSFIAYAPGRPASGPLGERSKTDMVRRGVARTSPNLDQKSYAALEQSAFHIFDAQEMPVQSSPSRFASASATNFESA